MMALRVIIVAVLSAMYPVSPQSRVFRHELKKIQVPTLGTVLARLPPRYLAVTPRKALFKNFEDQAAARIQVLAGLRRCVDWQL